MQETRSTPNDLQRVWIYQVLVLLSQSCCEQGLHSFSPHEEAHARHCLLLNHTCVLPQYLVHPEEVICAIGQEGDPFGLCGCPRQTVSPLSNKLCHLVRHLWLRDHDWKE